MIIKKFKAKDSRSVMAKVREEFGPEAILLSSKSVGDHFEMVATPNYDDLDIEEALANVNKPSQAALASNLDQVELAQRDQQQSLATVQDELAKLRQLMEAQLQLSNSLPNAMANPEDRQDANLHRTAAKSGRALPDPQHHIDQHLAAIGISKRLRESLQRRLEGVDKIEVASSKTMKILSSAVREVDLGSFPNQGIAAFIGNKGVGKTTSLIKIAQTYRRRKGIEGLGLVLFGKQENGGLLKKYASTLNISLIEAQTPRQLVSAVKSFSKKQLVLIDCLGTPEPSKALRDGLGALTNRGRTPIKLLAIAADSNRAQLESEINAYADLEPALIITKMDKARYPGSLVELLIRKKVPLGYVSRGKKLDGGLEKGNSERLIRMALDLGKLPESFGHDAARSQSLSTHNLMNLAS